jgi:hypothetical protein
MYFWLHDENQIFEILRFLTSKITSFFKILVLFSGENLPVNKKAAIHCPALVKNVRACPET